MESVQKTKRTDETETQATQHDQTRVGDRADLEHSSRENYSSPNFGVSLLSHTDLPSSAINLTWQDIISSVSRLLHGQIEEAIDAVLNKLDNVEKWVDEQCNGLKRNMDEYFDRF
ncbi:Uncharacterized protein Fot_32351 [Forsythia ovata]|uniref:Uncharacterized protein n=1 Tax=Forsythia ovata TaxID=205694 RepID=A0ABD1T7M2_9LAMI